MSIKDNLLSERSPTRSSLVELHYIQRDARFQIEYVLIHIRNCTIQVYHHLLIKYTKEANIEEIHLPSSVLYILIDPMDDYEGNHHKTNQFPLHLLSIYKLSPILP